MSQANYINSLEFYKGVTILRLAGAITCANVKDAQEEYRAKMKGRLVKNVLFDLKEVKETDTAGLAALISLFKYMRDNKIGEKIGLINISDKTKELLDISKTAILFHIFTSEEEAISVLQ